MQTQPTDFAAPFLPIDMDLIKKGKDTLRTICMRAREKMDHDAKKAADGAMIRTIMAHSAFKNADLILLFYPVRGEIDLLPLCDAALEKGISVAFPRCEGSEMTFHTVGRLDELEMGRFGIPAPRADAPAAKATERTLCILPGLAAGKDGTRLGYGGGFYDRYLTTFEGITLFPVYEKQLFPKLPVEEFDRLVDLIVTEKGVLARNV